MNKCSTILMGGTLMVTGVMQGQTFEEKLDQYFEKYNETFQKQIAKWSDKYENVPTIEDMKKVILQAREISLNRKQSSMSQWISFTKDRLNNVNNDENPIVAKRVKIKNHLLDVLENMKKDIESNTDALNEVNQKLEPIEKNFHDGFSSVLQNYSKRLQDEDFDEMHKKCNDPYDTIAERNESKNLLFKSLTPSKAHTMMRMDAVEGVIKFIEESNPRSTTFLEDIVCFLNNVDVDCKELNDILHEDEDGYFTGDELFQDKIQDFNFDAVLKGSQKTVVSLQLFSINILTIQEFDDLCALVIPESNDYSNQLGCLQRIVNYTDEIEYIQKEYGSAKEKYRNVLANKVCQQINTLTQREYVHKYIDDKNLEDLRTLVKNKLEQYGFKIEFSKK